MGSALKRKNLLLEEQILSFKRWPTLKRKVDMKITVAFTENVSLPKKKGSALKSKEFAPMEH